MLDSVRGFRAIVLTAMVLCIVASMKGAVAGEDSASGFRVGSIDPAQVLTKSSYATKSTDEVQKKYDAKIKLLTIMQQHPLLSEQDQAALGKLAAKDVPPDKLSDAETKEQKRLMDLSKKMLDEFDTLRTKQGGQLTLPEQDTLNKYSHIAADVEQRIRTQKAEADKEANDKLAEVRTKVLQDIKDNIKKVAASKKLNIVFDSSVALYCENDITDDVVKLMK